MSEKLYYRDLNHRVYVDDNGVRQLSPVYSKYFIAVEFGEDGKPKYGKLSKDKKKIKFGPNEWGVFTEQGMLDDIYINENAHSISNEVRYCRDVKKLKLIAEILNND